MVSTLLYSTVKESIFVYKITSTGSAIPEEFMDVVKKQQVFRKLGLGSHEAYLGLSGKVAKGMHVGNHHVEVSSLRQNALF